MRGGEGKRENLTRFKNERYVDVGRYRTRLKVENREERRSTSGPSRTSPFRDIKVIQYSVSVMGHACGRDVSFMRLSIYHQLPLACVE